MSGDAWGISVLDRAPEGIATDLDDALTAYSPDRQIVNTGNGSNANHFQLDFIDLAAQNEAGPNIVFFETRWSADPYELAVRPFGGVFSAFIPYTTADFINSGEVGCAEIWGLELELDDYGVGAGVLVDAIQFRALPRDGGGLEGDPLMAAVLNTGSTPVANSTWSTIKASFR